jgi:hypothetical protein
MPSAGFKPAIPATKRQQTYALDRAATVTGLGLYKNSLPFLGFDVYFSELTDATELSVMTLGGRIVYFINASIIRQLLEAGLLLILATRTLK